MFDSFNEIATSNVLLDVLTKATVLLVTAVILDRFLRKRSAALRHRLWCLTFVGLLALPLLATVLPAWRIPILSQVAEASPEPSTPLPNATPVVIQDAGDWAEEGNPVLESPIGLADETRHSNVDIQQYAQSQSSTTSEHDNQATALQTPVQTTRTTGDPLPWTLMLTAIWCLGTLVTLWPLLRGFIRIHDLGRASQKVDQTDTAIGWLQGLSARLGLGRSVRLLETTRSIVPVTWGVLWPVVLVPGSWRGWSPERRELVLLHELAHVKRFDVGHQIIARLSCAVYWFHPLAWYGLRKLRIERELACDDCVLGTGAQPTVYARALVDMAKQYKSLSLPTTVAMAQSTRLEERVRCLLDRARSRGPLGRLRASLLLGVATLLVTIVAMVEPVASKPIKIESTVVENKTDDVEPTATGPAFVCLLTHDAWWPRRRRFCP